MALSGYEITISVSQFFPSAGAVTSPTGGSWPAGTYSFKVVARYWTDSLEEDDAGVIRTNVTAWAGHAVTLNDKVTVTWTAATMPPENYEVYYIENATWTANGVLRGRKIAEVTGDVLTATILKPFLQQGASTNVVGTTTGGDSGTVLIDSTATFQTHVVKAGDTVSNVTDTSTATVVSVDSEIQLTTTALTGGGDNTWQTSDAYRVTSTTLLKDTAATFVTNGVEVGHYVILNAGASTPGAYAKITAVISETTLTTQVLTGSASYFLSDSYDVVYHVFPISTAATEIIVNPIKEAEPEVRQIMTSAYNGRLVKLSYARTHPLDGVNYQFYNSSMTLAEYQTILFWIYKGTRLQIVDEADNALITPIAGYFVNADNMGTEKKSTKQVSNLRFILDSFG